MITLKKKFTDSFNFLFNKIALVRVDFNVPFSKGIINDDTRIKKIIPTLKVLIEKKANIILVSHFGRPEGNWNEEFSLKAVCPELSKILGENIYFEPNNINNLSRDHFNQVFKKNNIILLENIRFYKEEEDLYINECFSSCHRNHSSISGMPKFLPSFPGKLLEEEISNLKNLILSNNKQNVAVLGGAKISTKLKIIEFYAKNYSRVLVGGAMANTFLHALGNEVGQSLYEKKMVKTARDIISIYGSKIILPKDAVVITKKNIDESFIKNLDEISKDDVIMDLGPQSRMIFANEVSKAENLLWNGPLG